MAIPKKPSARSSSKQPKIIKRNSKPETTYLRIIKSEYVEEEVKRRLTKEFKRINPFSLQKRLKKKIGAIMKMTVK